MGNVLAKKHSNTPSSEETWTLREMEVPAGEITIYKAVGEELSLAEYNAATRSNFQSDGDEDWDRDWSAMYTQFQKSHCLGTVWYRWEDERPCGEGVHEEARLMQVTFRVPIKVVICSGPVFYRGDVDGATKANIVKERLRLGLESGWTALALRTWTAVCRWFRWVTGLGQSLTPAATEDLGLMQALGEQGKALIMQETETEWELVFSHQHLASLLRDSEAFDEECVVSFFKHPKWPATSHWAIGGRDEEGNWKGGEKKRYGSDTEVLDEIGDSETPGWCWCS
uniref:Uncharacterized protein n=1 Tax=Chromera velia CCMP2878 TaxID=1169474 RepID=A0A0G4F5I1_9ALVE|eukprot:Cvel_2778.t1-p1 / transcript=Cvel_2778.t1 / gene=Cvel_2778 / organism=Chromera_velia_CCMP2878 / gene_product=hypothetical protein / transcript_product=hypothetical protein / location=Cvel_scaffold111:114333-115178(+) / protein_length=282 / sequence_SO=supercontig / SO=protein_coding / is_pseudo=false